MVVKTVALFTAALKALNPKYVPRNLLISTQNTNSSVHHSKDLVSKVENIKLSDAFEADGEITKQSLLSDMLVYEDFISPVEEEQLLGEIEPYLKRLRYEFDHWDDAIHGYRETERLEWDEKNSITLERLRGIAFPPGTPQLAHVHILDLAAEGYIKPHIDAIRFCGNTIAGISLLSDSVMRLVHENKKLYTADILLKRRSLYIMKDSARFDYTHEILADKASEFKNEKVPRQRRISIICRNEPSPDCRD